MCLWYISPYHEAYSPSDHTVAVPVDLTVQYQALLARQRSLVAQVAAERDLPLFLGRELHLPSIARLSAKLYSTTTASKSNLLMEGGVLREEGGGVPAGWEGEREGAGEDLEVQTVSTSRGCTPRSLIDIR